MLEKTLIQSFQWADQQRQAFLTLANISGIDLQPMDQAPSPLACAELLNVVLQSAWFRAKPTRLFRGYLH